MNNAERDIDRRSPAEIALSLHAFLPSTTLFVGYGQYSPYRDHERVMVLVVSSRDSGLPMVIWDRFYPVSAISSLCEALGVYAREVWRGEFDTMYATPWSYAWTTSPGLFRLCDRQGLLVEVLDDTVALRRPDSIMTISRSDVLKVVGWLSPDWYKRGVRMDLRQGSSLDIAETEEPMAHADPTYDGIDLMCDAAWVGMLGKAMAAGLGVPYIAEDSALR